MEHAETVSASPFVPSELERALDALHSPECVYFPIRHHSPACAWHLARLIRDLRPSAILVEGPIGFTPLIPAILDPDTKAPIAVYTHFIDVGRKLHKPAENELDLGPARFAAYYPFCDYSPELIALRVGMETGARLRFIDLDYADQVLAEHVADRQISRPRIQTLMEERHLQHSAYLNALARQSGCRDFNEMWDHLFEANFHSRSTESFMREVAAYCFFARHDCARDRQILLLNAWEGLDGAALAGVLGISRGGADAALSRARSRLREAWAGRLSA